MLSFRSFVALTVALIPLGLAGCGGNGSSSDWPAPDHDLSSTRSLPSSGINRANVSRLHVVWRFRFRAPPEESGAFTATPVVADGVVYLEDMQSNVFALDLQTGRVLWQRLFHDPDPGPNGLTVENGSVYGATATAVFALAAKTGRMLWHRFLITPAGPLTDARVTPGSQVVDVAPQIANGVVYASTVGYPPGGRGAVFALNASTGAIRWKLSTIRGRWSVPGQSGGGGAWYPPSVDGNDVFWGIANPYPYGGSRKYPNGSAYAGPALFTDSLLVADATTGKVRWYDQITPHDVRDHDFQLPPILASIGGKQVILGAGKGGIAIAWDAKTHRRLWQSPVGVHRNDAGPLPTHQVSVCPGLLGGVETPMAYAAGELFLPIVDLCMKASAYGYESLAGVNPLKGRGEFVALNAETGAQLWRRLLPQPDFGCATVADGVVFTSTFDGTVYAFDTRTGATLWRTLMVAGINACPALAGNMLLVPAGSDETKHGALALELDAWSTKG